MCGIAGVLNTQGMEREKLSGALQQLGTALKHRGPDDQGVWSNSAGTAGFAHVRLAILDLTPGGHQPMHTPDGNLHITFNGEIYNFRELRRELENEGVTFRTQSDTEVLLRLYEKSGVTMLPRLRGMFALAIWDEARQLCFLARDPLGIKPLYYTFSGGRLAFASEMRALQSAGLAGRQLDAEALVRYFQMGSVQEPHTLLADVHCLEAGHYLLWTGGRLVKNCYWRVAFATQEMEPSEAVQHVRHALQDSIDAHFVSDVPVGIFLSGGIDSTAVLALARAGGHENIDTFSIGVDDAEMDETGLAERTAKLFGAKHHMLRLDAVTGQQAFSNFLHTMDQPSVDGLNTYTVSAFAAQKGMKVVLSGLGGDELFAGYKSFDAVPRLHAFNRAAHGIPFAAGVAGWALERNPFSAKMRRIGSMLRQVPTVENSYRAFRGIFSLHEAKLLAASYLDCSYGSLPNMPNHQMQVPDIHDAVSKCEMTLYMRNQLLRDSDVMSMSQGLELRVPLVDRDLFERVAMVPAHLRLRRGKQMLLDAVPEVPEWIWNQPKRGFVFPFEKWLGQQWGDEFAVATRKLPYKNATWFKRWAVFMLDHWLERS
ncbi:asparagine synthase (glutamine-hydrolyzing) [Prosthecobacter sp.]|jgi:asparagine synthase (glutamine-hydrolysing)|uniref:asparagine synthase (glutamine-hydrolyzing) n=1 Tax=Prosthecobacter sp. TaxID=1965333 RepID=UPI0037C88305